MKVTCSRLPHRDLSQLLRGISSQTLPRRGPRAEEAYATQYTRLPLSRRPSLPAHTTFEAETRTHGGNKGRKRGILLTTLSNCRDSVGTLLSLMMVTDYKRARKKTYASHIHAPTSPSSGALGKCTTVRTHLSGLRNGLRRNRRTDIVRGDGFNLIFRSRPSSSTQRILTGQSHNYIRRRRTSSSSQIADSYSRQHRSPTESDAVLIQKMRDRPTNSQRNRKNAMTSRARSPEAALPESRRSLMDAMDKSPISLLRSCNCNRRHINRNLLPSLCLLLAALIVSLACSAVWKRPLPAYIKNVMFKTLWWAVNAFPPLRPIR